MSNPTRYDVFNYDDNYKEAVIIGGRQDEDWSYNLAQQIQDNERRALADSIFQSKAIVSGLVGGPLNNSTGACTISSGSVYIDGRVEPVPGATLNYGSSVTNETIYVQWLRQRITKVQDATLVDPNTLSPVFECDQVNVTLASSTPDAFDEEFENFIGNAPFNTRLGAAWTLSSGTFNQSCPGKDWSRFALQMNYTSGTATVILSPFFPVLPSTTYYLYFWTKTVYGQTDLQSSDGANVKVELASPFTTTFATTGGSTLQGGYTQTAVSFTTGSTDTDVRLAITIPSTASPSSTQILVDSILLTTLALGTTPQQIERHYDSIYNWNRTTTPSVLTPIVSPASALNINEFQGELPATDISFTPDGSTAPDITSGTVQTAIDQLSTQRALLAGNSSQVFSAAAATVLTEVPTALQIQEDAISWCTGGAYDGFDNLYTVFTALGQPTYVVGERFRFLAGAANTANGTFLQANNGYPYETNIGLTRPDGTQIQVGDIRNGQVVTFEITSISPTVTAQMYAPPAQYVTQNGVQNYVVDTGSANAYTVTLTPAPISIIAGFNIRVLIANTNTGESQITVNGTAANIVRATGVNLIPNDLLAGGIFELVYNGTAWQLVSVSGGLLESQQTYGVSSAKSGKITLGSPVSIGNSNTAILSTTLVMPTTGVQWQVHFTTGMYTQMLYPPDSSGASVDVTTAMWDGIIATPDPVSEAYTLATANNQTKKVHIHGTWDSGFYSPSQSVTFTLYASATITGSAGQPTALGVTTTYLKWNILSAD